MEITEQVLCIAVTAFFCGIANCNGGGSLFRNLARTVGLPRGAKVGLDELEEASRSRLGRPRASSLPSPFGARQQLHLRARPHRSGCIPSR